MTVALVLALIGGLAGWSSTALAEQAGRRRIEVVATMCGFDPAQVEVERGDLVAVAFRATDVAHSFVVDDYRIAKRAQAGQTVTFEFHADHSGQFSYYCNIDHQHTCDSSNGRLVVR